MVPALLAAGMIAAASPGPPPPAQGVRACNSALPHAGQAFAGSVERVGDGDSLCVRTVDGLVAVRLVDFNAPELGEPAALIARDALRRLALGRRVECRAGHRSWRRTVALCRLDGIPLGDMLRRAGVPEGGR